MSLNDILEAATKFAQDLTDQGKEESLFEMMNRHNDFPRTEAEIRTALTIMNILMGYVCTLWENGEKHNWSIGYSIDWPGDVMHDYISPFFLTLFPQANMSEATDEESKSRINSIYDAWEELHEKSGREKDLGYPQIKFVRRGTNIWIEDMNGFSLMCFRQSRRPTA